MVVIEVILDLTILEAYLGMKRVDGCMGTMVTRGDVLQLKRSCGRYIEELL